MTCVVLDGVKWISRRTNYYSKTGVHSRTVGVFVHQNHLSMHSTQPANRVPGDSLYGELYPSGYNDDGWAIWLAPDVTTD